MAKALTAYMGEGKLPAVSDAQVADALAGVVDDAGGISQAGITFLGFSGKQGVYSLGRSKNDVSDDRLFIVEPTATIAGWTCWKESQAVGKHKWLATDALRNPDVKIREEDLKDFSPYRKNSGDGWKPMLGIGLVELTDMTTSIEYSSTAVSAINGLKDLIQEMGERTKEGEPPIPVIWLGREQFTAQGQTNWKPTFNVDCWVTREAAMAFGAGDMTEDDLRAGNAPKNKRGRRAAAKK